MVDQQGRLDPPQVEALAARQYGQGDLTHLGGGEDEFYVRGRFLQGLQERIEGALGQHVHLVDEIDLVARQQGLVARAFDDLADVVNASVGGALNSQPTGRRPSNMLAARLAKSGMSKVGLSMPWRS